MVGGGRIFKKSSLSLIKTKKNKNKTKHFLIPYYKTTNYNYFKIVRHEYKLWKCLVETEFSKRALIKKKEKNTFLCSIIKQTLSIYRLPTMSIA